MLVVLALSPAHACSCLVGPGGFVHAPAVVVPSNARGLVWWSTTGPPADAGVRVKRGGQPVPATIEPLDRNVWLVAPAEGFVAGAAYTFGQEAVPFGAGALASEVAVTVSREKLAGAPATLTVGPVPTGALRVAAGASCSASVEAAQVALAADLPVEARPFAAALVWETAIDGKPWRPAESICSPTPWGRSWRETGQDLVYAACAEAVLGDRGTTLGGHEVRMTARLPGTDVAFSATAAIALACPR